ncbi:MAG: DUF4291 domain-containing protein [Bacteroidetes bacterium]|nr:DUF4291 domain-containing protein [Bacteroidota bacterium]
MKTEQYKIQAARWPSSGRQVMGRVEGDALIVYQAFNPHIAEWAVTHQQFGGPHYSFNRMSWIKPGFLWMMYRAGWASKEHQQHILAIKLPMVHFKTILREATITSYDSSFFSTEKEWKNELERTEVRLQWDPDHNPAGVKQERKAIQIGMKGNILRQFCTEWITEIADITPYVKAEHKKVLDNRLNELILPYEDVISLKDPAIEKRIGIVSV